MASNEFLYSETVNIDPGQYALKERKLRSIHFISYIFPFEPNPNWSKCDADGAEIDKCIVDTVDKYGLKEPIVFDTKLVKSIWNQERCKWALELKQNDKIIHDEADFLTNGSGILNQWKMPGIAGLNQFTGKLVHTAAWDKAYDWTNEKIALLGNGSSEHNKLLFDVDAISGLMRQHLSENPDLTDKLIPKFEIGCHRLNAGGGYLEALQQPNAEWCFEGIDEITEADIRTAAGEEEFDLIVCATGFEASFVPGWELAAREGRRLDVEWKETPEAYFSICAGGGIANYFMFNGPSCPIGHGSVPQMISCTADYILKWTKKIAREDIKSVVVNDSAVRNYNRRAQAGLERPIWSKG
ncbi:hypothetical protein LT330_002785 [Penicillium expansum]|nr:hypothetical protein LT330_002785 [Penicillium expansum]